jgi:NAD-dependent dihydropyrimidine dehydrogenase PreA subunit
VNQTDPNCKQDAGRFAPLIDRNRCEGQEDCVKACPYDVFTIGTLPSEQRQALSLVGKLKGFGHRWQQAFATNVEACHACGLCVSACPEEAITLRRTGVFYL